MFALQSYLHLFGFEEEKCSRKMSQLNEKSVLYGLISERFPYLNNFSQTSREMHSDHEVFFSSLFSFHQTHFVIRTLSRAKVPKTEFEYANISTKIYWNCCECIFCPLSFVVCLLNRISKCTYKSDTRLLSLVWTVCVEYQNQFQWYA